MSTTGTVRLDLKIRAPLVQDNPAGTIPGEIDALIQLSGVEVTKRHYKRYTIAASGAQSLDLVSALADGFGNALTFTKVKFLAVVNRSTSLTAAGTLERPASNGVPIISAAATVPIDPLIVIVNKAGATVTAGTGDLISVNNGDASASADFDVLIAGV
jgi:hypothetical protein